MAVGGDLTGDFGTRRPARPSRSRAAGRNVLLSRAGRAGCDLDHRRLFRHRLFVARRAGKNDDRRFRAQTDASLGAGRAGNRTAAARGCSYCRHSRPLAAAAPGRRRCGVVAAAQDHAEHRAGNWRRAAGANCAKARPEPFGVLCRRARCGDRDLVIPGASGPSASGPSASRPSAYGKEPLAPLASAGPHPLAIAISAASIHPLLPAA